MFLSEECADFIAAVAENCRRQLELFNAIKNASVRVRRSVLGEIKEKTEGGLYYTKPFRELMNEVTAAEEFFSGDLKNEKIKNYSFFYNRLLSFYRAGVVYCAGARQGHVGCGRRSCAFAGDHCERDE